jgi:YVTN family beta-propeller protein
MVYADALVFKEYKSTALATLNSTALEAMPRYLESLPFSEGMELINQAAWPCRLVENAGAVEGFVMPAIPDKFFLTMRKASGPTRVAGEFQHLLNDSGFLARRQIVISDRNRYELLTEVANALSIFHRHDIAVGDVSPKNLLFATSPRASVYFIDCDAMRLKGNSVLPQLETPGWEVPTGNSREELATVTSDSYKFGLLALRMLVGDQDTKDTARLPKDTPSPIRQLISESLSPRPRARPAPEDWGVPLTDAASTASTGLQVVPPTSINVPSSSPRPTRYASPGPLGSAQLPSYSPSTRLHRLLSNRRRIRLIAAATGIVTMIGLLLSLVAHAKTAPRGPANTVLATIPVGAYPREVAVTPDGKRAYVAVGGYQADPSKIVVIDTSSNTIAASIPVPNGLPADSSVGPVTVAPDGQHAYTMACQNKGRSCEVAVIDVDSDTVASTIPVSSPYGDVTIALDGRHLYITTSNSTPNILTEIDTATGTVSSTVDLNTDVKEPVVIHPDGRHAYITNYTTELGEESASLSVIDLISHTVTASIPLGELWSSEIAFTEGHHAYITCARSVAVIDTASNALLSKINVGGEPEGIAVAPDGGRVYVANSYGGGDTVSVIDTSSASVIATIAVGHAPREVSITTNGGRLYVSNDDSGTVSAIDTSTNSVIATIPTGANPKQPAIAADGRHVYVPNNGSGTVSVIDTGLN